MPDTPASIRSRALALVGLTLAVLAFGIVLLTAFDPGVEMLDAEELVARSDDAQAFLIADYFYIVLYSLLLPATLWRFGESLGDAGPPTWVRAAALLFMAAGVVDLVENTLLITSTDSVSQGSVDAAHVAGWVNIVLFTAGALPGLLLLVRALGALRQP
jgi:hypothetical protein